MQQSYTIAGLRADTMEDFANYASAAADRHQWPKGMPEGVRFELHEMARAAREATVAAVRLTTLLAIHRVDHAVAPGIPDERGAEEDGDEIDDCDSPK